MNYRQLGRTDMKVSAISFGAWAIGGTWGPVDDEQSLKALHAAIDAGTNFVDTADVYGDGRSERLMARLRKERKEALVVATKAGRRLDPHVTAGYNRENLTAFVERSLRNLEAEAIDLLQLHCPPTDVYYRPEVFGVLDDLKRAGKLRHYGVSVERVEEALKAIEYPRVQSVQIIYNIFRQRPADEGVHFLRCGLCSAAWPYPASHCAFCGNHEPDTLRYFTLQDSAGTSYVQGCDECRGYLKAVVTDGPLPAAVKTSLTAWAGCIAGALDVNDYRAAMAQAGFTDITITPTYFDHATIEEAVRDMGSAVDLGSFSTDTISKTVFSARITARKP